MHHRHRHDLPDGNEQHDQAPGTRMVRKATEATPAVVSCRRVQWHASKARGGGCCSRVYLAYEGMTMRARGAGRSRRPSGLRSLPRGFALVVSGAMLTLAQTALQQQGAEPWAHILAAVLVAGLAIASEFDRHQREVQQSEHVDDGRVPPSALAADQLAGVVRRAWVAEANRRGITTPAPASVRWHWGSADVAVPSGEVASQAVPALTPGTLAGVDAGPQEGSAVLESGVVTRLHDEVYARLP